MCSYNYFLRDKIGKHGKQGQNKTERATFSLVMWTQFHVPRRWYEEYTLAVRWLFSSFSLLRIGQGKGKTTHMALIQTAKAALVAVAMEPCNVHLFYSANSTSLSMQSELSILC